MNEDLNAIMQTIDRYAIGGTSGNRAMVAEAFHPSATMKFLNEDTLMDIPIADYFRDYIKEGVTQHRTVSVENISVYGTCAQAKLSIVYDTHTFHDYFNLLRIGGQWLIVNKIFHKTIHTKS